MLSDNYRCTPQHISLYVTLLRCRQDSSQQMVQVLVSQGLLLGDLLTCQPMLSFSAGTHQLHQGLPPLLSVHHCLLHNHQQAANTQKQLSERTSTQHWAASAVLEGKEGHSQVL